jgi:predicted  nucleic acid-binding Zn-ribbon protein
MTPTDTPRTDAETYVWQNGEENPFVQKEFARQLERDLAASQAEVAKLNHQLLKTESDLLQSQDINSFLDTEFRIACKRAEKAEEELAEIKETYASIVQQPHFDEREVHCSCVPALREEVARLREAYLKSIERDDFLTQEVDRLKEELEIAVYGCGCDNYLQTYCDKHNPYNKTK